MKDAPIKVAGVAIVVALITLLVYAVFGLVAWEWDVRNWSEMWRALWVGNVITWSYLWMGGSARSALDRLW